VPFRQWAHRWGSSLELEQHLPEARLGLLLETVRPQQIDQCLAALGVTLLQRQVREQSLPTAQRNRDRTTAGPGQGESAEELKLHANRPLRKAGSNWFASA
jgi:hypothetical protein